MTAKFFAIAGEQRSGTIMLGDLLNSHPEIHVVSEIFLNFPHEYDSYFRFLAELVKSDSDRAFPEHNLSNVKDFLSSLSRSTSKPFIAFHLKYDQVAYVAGLLAILRDLNVSLIHNIRRNCLETLISQYTLAARRMVGLNAHTGVTTQEEKVSPVFPPGDQFLFDLVSMIARIRAQQMKLRPIGRYLEVFHEDLVGEASAFYLQQIQKFVGVEPKALQSTLRKSGSSGLEQLGGLRENREFMARLETIDYVLGDV